MGKARKGKSTWVAGKHLTENHKNKISIANKGRSKPSHTQSEETRIKISEARKGMRFTDIHRENISKARKGIYMESSTMFVKGDNRIVGENNPNWKGGITPINEKIRKTKEYTLWRIAVFMRDDYTCQSCNIRGGSLQADHIKPFAFYPELRFAIDNGRTLCKDCHRQTDTYGKRAFTYE